jgi:hypothetical protein
VPPLSIIGEALRGTVVPSGDVVCADAGAENIRRVRRHRNRLTIRDRVRIGLLGI